MDNQTHVLIRTSPKGEHFVGKCVKCGKTDLLIGAALEPCEVISRFADDIIKLIDKDDY